MSAMLPRIFTVLLLLTILLAGLPSPVPAGGQFGEHLEDFQNHLDAYQQEIELLAGRADALAEAYAAGEDIMPLINEYINAWEKVDVHGAIETRATITYPPIWQAIIRLRQAAESGRPAAEVRALATGIKQALWQGMGAVRLAAGQAAAEPQPPAPAAAPATPRATVERIIEELRQSVAAYQARDTERARKLIHSAYMNRFEGLEGELIALDPELVSGLEQDFNATLPLLMEQGAPLDQVQQQLDAMIADLERAAGLLAEARESRSEVF